MLKYTEYQNFYFFFLPLHLNIFSLLFFIPFFIYFLLFLYYLFSLSLSIQQSYPLSATTIPIVSMLKTQTLPTTSIISPPTNPPHKPNHPPKTHHPYHKPTTHAQPTKIHPPKTHEIQTTTTMPTLMTNKSLS